MHCHAFLQIFFDSSPSLISRHFSDSGWFLSAAKCSSVYPRSSRLFKSFGSRSAALFKMSSNLWVLSTRVGSNGRSITFFNPLMIHPVFLGALDILLACNHISPAHFVHISGYFPDTATRASFCMTRIIA